MSALTPYVEQATQRAAGRLERALVSAASSTGDRLLRSGKRYVQRVVNRNVRRRRLFGGTTVVGGKFAKMPYGRVGRYRRSYSRFKKRRKFGRTNIGAPVGSGTAKSVVTQNVTNVPASGPSTFSALFVNQFPLCNIQRQDAFNQLNRRKGDQVNLRGIKICLDLRNTSPTVSLIVHVCILAPRSGLTVLANDFFRGHGDTDKNIDMTNTTPPFNWQESTCNGINTDLYTILMHKRIFLDYNDKGVGITAGNEYSKNRKMIKKYLKLKRQLQYDGTGTTPESAPPILVIWYDTYRRLATSPATNDLLDYYLYTVTYFRDPK